MCKILYYLWIQRSSTTMKVPFEIFAKTVCFNSIALLHHHLSFFFSFYLLLWTMSIANTSRHHLHHHQRTASEPHSYNIQAKLRNGVLSIFVHDTVLDLQWRQEFTQISFPGHRLYDVAKVLIMAIQEMIHSTNTTNYQPNVPKPIAILVYNQWCYLTVYNSNLPSFALRPIAIPHHNQPKKQKQSKTDKHSLALSLSQNENYSTSLLMNMNRNSCSTLSDISSQSDFEDVLVINSDVEEYNTAHSSNDSLFTNDGITDFEPRRLFHAVSCPSTDTDDHDDDEEEEEQFESDLFENKFYSRFRANKMWSNKKKKKKKKELTILLNGEEIPNVTDHAFEQQLAEDEYYEEEEDDEEQPLYDPNYLGIAPYYDE
eukprot:209922_1